MTTDFDLLVRAGRVVCPQSGFDGPGAVATRGDRIVACGAGVDGVARRTIDRPDGLLVPGLVDLHAHPALSGSKFGVDPDLHFLPRGVTTVMSQGDAGADGCAEYLRDTVATRRTRVRLAINLSRVGESAAGGCFERLEWADVDACVAAARAAADAVWGVAVNVSAISCGPTDPRTVLQRALRAAEELGKPLLFGVHTPRAWPFEEQLALLRPGDVMTYCFRGGEHSIVREDGRVHPAIRAARARGVRFDVGHGMASFSFPVAEAAIADGFPPDTISTDGYARHIGQIPPHDLPRTMSKLRAASMPELAVLAAATSRPAAVLGLADEIGRLTPGAGADLTVLELDHAHPLIDTEGKSRPGPSWRATLTIRAGEVAAP